MSTRGLIGYKEKGSSDVHYAYVHHDAYISYVGTILNECYNEFDKVKELVDKGNMSGLGTSINATDYYGENSNYVPAIAFKYKEDEDIDYLYLYDEEKGNWTVENQYGKGNLDIVCDNREYAADYLGVSPMEFTNIQTHKNGIANYWQSWCPEPLTIFNSIYDENNKSVLLYFHDSVKQSGDIECHIPCEDRNHAKRISDSIAGLSFNEIERLFEVATEYSEYTITKNDSIFETLKEAFDKQKFYRPEPDLTFTVKTYQDNMTLTYQEGNALGMLSIDENLKEKLNDYIDSCYFSIDNEYECRIVDECMFITQFSDDWEDGHARLVLHFDDKETARNVFDFAEKNELICTSTEEYLNEMNRCAAIEEEER